MDIQREHALTNAFPRKVVITLNQRYKRYRNGANEYETKIRNQDKGTYCVITDYN